MPELPTSNEIMSIFPAMSDSFKKRVFPILDGFLKGIEHYTRLHDSQVESLNKELHFHKNLYEKYNSNLNMRVTELENWSNDLNTLKKEIAGPLVALKKDLVGLAVNYRPDNVLHFLEKAEVAIDQLLKSVAGCS